MPKRGSDVPFAASKQAPEVIIAWRRDQPDGRRVVPEIFGKNLPHQIRE